MRALYFFLTFAAAFPLQLAFHFLPEGASEIVKVEIGRSYIN